MSRLPLPRPLAFAALLCLGLPVLPAQTVPFVGTLHPNQDVKVSSEIDGTVRAVEADLGDRVSARQVLAKLDDEREMLQLQIQIGLLQEALLKMSIDVESVDSVAKAVAFDIDAIDVHQIPSVVSAQEDLKEKERDLERARQLLERGAASQDHLDRALTAREKAWADMRTAVDQMRGFKALIRQLKSGIMLYARNLSDTAVTSPATGYVQERHVEAGEYVNKGQTLFRILDTDTLRLRGSIPSRHAAAVKRGMKVTFTVDSLPGRTFEGTVTRLAPAVDESTRTLLLEIRVENRQQTLRPGYYVKAELNLDTPEVTR